MARQSVVMETVMALVLIKSPGATCWVDGGQDLPKFFIRLRRQSVSGRNKCLCCSSHALCYGRVRLGATHNSFASYNGNVIHACRANKADHQ